MDGLPAAGSVVRLHPLVAGNRRSTDVRLPAPRAVQAGVSVERRLVLRAAAGDESAWISLVDTHVAAVWTAALVCCADRGEAERVCAVVWLRFAQALGSLATDDVETWLRQCLDEVSRSPNARGDRPAGRASGSPCT